MQEKYILDIGRYQIVHKGHEDKFKQVIKFAREQGYNIKNYIVGVGSSQISRTKKNPLNTEERTALLSAMMLQLGVPYQIVPIPDINNPLEYAEYVEGLIPEINQDNTLVVSGNEYTTKCFERFSRKYEVFKPKTRVKINATSVREIINSGQDYRKFIDPKIIREMKMLGIEQIIKEVYTKYVQVENNLCVDAIIIVEDKGEEYIVLIERGRGPFTGFLALPGGRLDKDSKTGKVEDEEVATFREIEEETRIQPKNIASIESFRRYESGNDPRGGSSLVYIVRTKFNIEEAREVIKCGDDAADIKLEKLDLDTLPHLAFQHFEMIQDYMNSREGGKKQ